MHTETHRYVIIGAGPGGLQLGYYLQQAGEDYVILEAGDTVGSFFREFPRHRKLISINKRHTGYSDPDLNMRWDWNSLLSDDGGPLFRDYSRAYFPDADDLVRYLEDFASHARLSVRLGARVVEIDRDEQLFVVRDAEGRAYRCDELVVATGLSTPYVPSIPGIEWTENYADASTNPDDYEDQRVLIIGKGNSAFEVADNLIATARTIHLCSPMPLKMAWATHFVGHLRAVNNDFLDTYQLKSQNAVLDATIEAIEVGDTSRARRATDRPAEWSGAKFRVSVAYRHANGEREHLFYDRIITCTGWSFDRSMFTERCMPQAVINRSSSGWDPGKYPAMTAEYESINIQGLHFAGTVTAMRDYHKTTSAFIHGFRYNARALFRILRRSRHGEYWPSRPVDARADAIGDALLERANRSSALWQQFGYIADVVAVTDEGARYFEDVPLDYVRAGGLELTADYYTLTLEYGENHMADPFNVARVHREDAEHADRSQFLHPIVRRLDPHGQLVSEHHVIEDLASEWREAIHREPLVQYLELELPMRGSAGGPRRDRPIRRPQSVTRLRADAASDADDDDARSM